MSPAACLGPPWVLADFQTFTLFSDYSNAGQWEADNVSQPICSIASRENSSTAVKSSICKLCGRQVNVNGGEPAPVVKVTPAPTFTSQGSTSGKLISRNPPSLPFFFMESDFPQSQRLFSFSLFNQVCVDLMTIRPVPQPQLCCLLVGSCISLCLSSLLWKMIPTLQGYAQGLKYAQCWAQCLVHSR